MRQIAFPVFIVLVLMGLRAGAQSLWQQSEFGMTPAQVQKNFPNAQPPSSPSRLQGGATELLRISDTEIVGHHFKSSFYFKDSKLVQVTLSLTDNESANGAKLVFDSLSDALKAKYGAEMSKNSTGGIMTTISSTWLSGKTNITLYYNVVGKTDPILNLIYQVRISSDAEKL